MRYMDLDKARERMAAANLDALLVAVPDNIVYVTGFTSLLSNMWHEAGLPTVWALVPAASAPAMLVPETEARGARAASGLDDVQSYPIWVDIDRVPAESADSPDIQAVLRSAPSADAKPAQRPNFFDEEIILGRLTDLLAGRGLLESRIGLEQDFVSQRAYALLRDKLPDVTFADGAKVLRDLRVVKTPAEIEHLRTATWLAEQGILGATTNVREGTRHGDIRLQFQLGAVNAVQKRPDITGFQGAGAGVRVGPNPWVSTPDAVVQVGDLIMFDCGATVNSYHSDIGRTFAYGRATEAQKRIQAALAQAHQAACEALKPGNRFCDVFEAGTKAMHAQGFETYRRGHLGHSVGLYVLEELPTISANETRVLEPDMVLALELPWYIDGIGGFQCEDIVRITGNGYENFNALSHELVII